MGSINTPRSILIVEDDRTTAALVAAYLEREGFRTVHAGDGRSGLMMFRRQQPAFVILDLMLPAIDGWRLCREFRAISPVPILILTARQGEKDRVLGLTMGADDYVMKPFSPRELVARVKAILRRTEPPIAEPGALTCGDLALDPVKQKVTVRGRAVRLTPSELVLLKMLMGSPGRIFSRRELVAWLYPDGGRVVERVVDVHIGKLRQKIEDDPAKPRRIRTLRGMGYELSENDDEPRA